MKKMQPCFEADIYVYIYIYIYIYIASMKSIRTWRYADTEETLRCLNVE